VRVAEYGASRRADVADLMGRVWGTRPAEDELAWFYERNPVRPASVLLAEEDGRVVGSAAISYQPLGGETVGFAVHLATDPAFRGRGFFSELQATNEERARASGVGLLLTVPTDASAHILTRRLGWTRLPPLRLWARPLPPRTPAQRVERLGDAWLDWRFAEAPRAYALYADGTVVGRRGRISYLARGRAGAATLALDRSFGEGYVPTPKRFTLLGKSLDGSPLPTRARLELGDLDFL
jgi:GNAT superfamily N-acetyltransferase